MRGLPEQVDICLFLVTVIELKEQNELIYSLIYCKKYSYRLVLTL